MIALFVERRVFWDPMAINDDVRNQAYWMNRILDPSLYPNDLIANYFTQPSLISPAVWWLYALVSHWIDPLRFSQFLPFPLIVLTTFFLFKFAESYAGSRYAFWACWLFNVFIWTVRNFAGGLPRAFFYPLLFLFLWQAEKRSIWGINLTLCLSSLIYPPALLLQLGLLLYDFWRFRKAPSQGLQPTVWLGIISSLGIGFWRYLQTASPTNSFGKLLHLPQALQIPEFFPGGRIPLFVFPSFSSTLPWNILQAPLQMIPHLYITIPTFLLIAVWFLYQKYFKTTFGTLQIPPVIWRLMGVSLALYLLAWITLFYLYVPERYLQFTLPLVIVFVLAALWHQIEQRFPTFRTRFLLWAVPCVIANFLWQPDIINSSTDSRALLQFLSHTPKSTMIAANLRLSSNIAPLAKRSIFISHEGYIPFHQGYFKTMNVRLKDWLSAYYATDPRPLKHFLDTYAIDYLIIDANDYERERLNTLAKNYYHAFDASFFRQLNHANRTQYILYRLGPQYAIYRNDMYWVLPTQTLKKVLSQSSSAVSKQTETNCMRFSFSSL